MDAVTSNNRVIMKMVVGRRDLQFNMALNHDGGVVYFTFPKFYLLQR
jgi:hypothetical protein